MRRLRRPGVLVPSLAPDGAGGSRRARQIEDYDRDGTIPSTSAHFPEHWRKPDVIGALYAMQGRVCAYCGADIEEAGIDVEHFRPKGRVDGDDSGSGYWWLAYDFSNYVLSCTVCNQKYKRNRFPLEEGAVRAGYEGRDGLASEPRILLDPSCDDVEHWIAVDWTKPAGRLVANAALGAAEKDRVEKVLRFFRLNFKVAHRRKRLAIQRLVVEKIDQNKPEEVRHLAIRYQPHSIVAQQILEAKGHPLPSPEEELEWLLDQLSADLLSKLEDLQDPSATELDEKEAKELAWALAVLWKDPPAGAPDSVADFLERRGLKDFVAEYVALL